jgi:hypothetical protein
VSVNKETYSEYAAYATMPNILVPKVQAGGKALVQNQAKTDHENRLSGKSSGKTLSSAPTLDQEQ